MLTADAAAVYPKVAWAMFALALALGAVMNRTQFCTMGALADIVHTGDWTRMRMWIGAIGVALIGTAVLAGAGLIDPAKTIYAGPRLRWLSAIIGGLAFGFGMVLASGCASKTLVRIGGGSLKSLLVFIVLGISAYATLRGLFAVVRVGWLDPVSIDLAGGQDLPRLLAAGDADKLPALRFALGGALGALCLIFALAGPEFRRPAPLIGALGVGAAVIIGWWISGRLGHIDEDTTTLAEAFVATNSGRMESLSFVAPSAYTLELLMLWTDRSKIVTIGIASILGVIVGSAIAALASRSFRWESFRDTDDTVSHLIGAALMGAGGVTALGCTIGQGISGISTLALGSFIALPAIWAGAIAALKMQAWRIGRLP